MSVLFCIDKSNETHDTDHFFAKHIVNNKRYVSGRE
jgi:hypothetical protein